MNASAVRCRLTVLAAALSAACPAWSQTPAIDDAKRDKSAPAATSEARMQVVQVKASRNLYDPRRDDTASKTVVNSDEITRYGDTNVLDVLKRVPGITVDQANGSGAIRMRGLAGNYTQILINGERAPAGFTIDQIPPEMIEKIEVLRAASAEYSTQSIAGTINVITKKAVRMAVRELKLQAGGSRDESRPSANFNVSDKVDNLTWSLNGAVNHNRASRAWPTEEEGFDAQGQQNLRRDMRNSERQRGTRLNLGPRLSWALEDGGSLTLQAYLNHNRSTTAGHFDADTSLGTEVAYPDVDYRNSHQAGYGRADVNWVNHLDSGDKLDLKLGVFSSSWDSNNLRAGPHSDPARPALDTRIASDSNDEGLSTSGKWTSSWLEGHSLMVGWDAGYSTREDMRAESELGVARPREDFDAQVSRLAVFAQDEFNLTPNWSMYLGARWEGFRTETGGTNVEDVTAKTSVLSPIFQTLYKLPGGRGDQMRFAVTRTFKAPNTWQLTARRWKSTENKQEAPDNSGNPNLKPELALGFDAAYEHYWAEGALLSVSAGVRKIEGLIRNDLVEERPNYWVTYPSNLGDATTRSLELEAKFPLKLLMDEAPEVDVRASVNRNWSEVDFVPGPDNRLDQQVPLTANLGVDYKTGQLTTGGSFTFRSGGPVRLSERQTALTMYRHDLELYGLWKFDSKNQLRVALSNMLGEDWIGDNTYERRDAAGNLTGTVRRVSAWPVDLSLRATMEMRF
jgi:outer membrane receptor protein involved in Fe transport